MGKLVKAIAEAKKITHWLAAGMAAVIGFMESPAGQALIKQYPHIEPIVSFLTIAALYFNSKK